MTTAPLSGNWPSEREKLLLRAGLCEPPRALAAWMDFCDDVADIRALASACYALFPLVAVNLQNCGEVPHRDLISGVSRYAWVKNQSRWNEVMPAVKALLDAGIDVLLLEGTWLPDLYRQQGRVRPTASLDILVHLRDVTAAVGILQGLGFAPDQPIPPGQLPHLFRFGHKLTVKNASGTSLDLCWHLLADIRHLDAEEDFWREAGTCPSPAPFPARTLASIDQFILTCLHGAQWNAAPYSVWVADAVMLVRQGLDWSRLEEKARRLERIEPVRNAILFLDSLEITLPPGVPEYWRALPITDFEKRNGGYRAFSSSAREREKYLAWIFVGMNGEKSWSELWRNLPAQLKKLHHLRAYPHRVAVFCNIVLMILQKRARALDGTKK